MVPFLLWLSSAMFFVIFLVYQTNGIKDMVPYLDCKCILMVYGMDNYIITYVHTFVKLTVIINRFAEK